MLAYRILLKTFSTSISAPGLSGRWNGSGRKVVYCAESIALAFLENMVRRQGVGFNSDFRIMILDIPDDLAAQTITVADLSDGWRSFTDYSICQALGNAWYDAGTFPILKVPSAILPESANYVLHSLHDEFKRITLIGTTELVPDERIEALLKNYKTR
jgi:RES domain-containing protein